MPSRHDRLLPCLTWQTSAALRRGALLAALTLPVACDDDGGVAHAPAALGDAGTPPSPTEDAGREPAPQRVGIAQLPDVASGGSPESDALALGVLERLEDLCGECHANGNNGAGFSGGLDLARLIETGMIVPGSSVTSPLLARIVDGSMPPERSANRYLTAATAGDIALIADFIDQLSTGTPPACEPLPFVGLDTVYAALLADVLGRPAEERRYLRYVSLTEASNARLCGPALEQQRQALLKLVNSLSTQDDTHVPIAIDPAALLYRIDLRHYGWDRDIDLHGDGTVDFLDGWEAAMSVVPHGVTFAGFEAGPLSAETGAPVPLSSLSVLTRAAGDGDVYRALLGAPDALYAKLYPGETPFGVDLIAEFEAQNVQRAGFVRSPPNSEVLVSRFSLGELDERAYWLYDIEDSGIARGGSIFNDPFGLIMGTWTKTIWELPNGLHGYLVNDDNGTSLLEMPRKCEIECVRPGQRHAIGCMGCHAGGVRPMQDAIRPYVELNPIEFDPYAYADVLAIFPPAAELDQIIAADNARYRAALERAGVTADAPDPVSRVYLDFDRPLDLERAAAELGVPTEVLTDHLGALPALAPLGDRSGTIERSVFDATHLDALCAVHATSRNRPASCP